VSGEVRPVHQHRLIGRGQLGHLKGGQFRPHLYRTMNPRKRPEINVLRRSVPVFHGAVILLAHGPEITS
jgi:hypothetical protein